MCVPLWVINDEWYIYIYIYILSFGRPEEHLSLDTSSDQLIALRRPRAADHPATVELNKKKKKKKKEKEKRGEKKKTGYHNMK